MKTSKVSGISLHCKVKSGSALVPLYRTETFARWYLTSTVELRWVEVRQCQKTAAKSDAQSLRGVAASAAVWKIWAALHTRKESVLIIDNWKWRRKKKINWDLLKCNSASFLWHLSHSAGRLRRPRALPAGVFPLHLLSHQRQRAGDQLAAGKQSEKERKKEKERVVRVAIDIVTLLKVGKKQRQFDAGRWQQARALHVF